MSEHDENEQPPFPGWVRSENGDGWVPGANAKPVRGGGGKVGNRVVYEDGFYRDVYDEDEA